MSYRHTTILFFFFNATSTTEIYTLSLHDALPISRQKCGTRLHGTAGIRHRRQCDRPRPATARRYGDRERDRKSTTSELQSPMYLVCRLLLEKKKKER